MANINLNRRFCIIGAACAAAFALSACAHKNTDSAEGESASYLFVWAGDADGEQPDFLAVIDARRESSAYGQIVATLPVAMQGGMPHHTEYEYPAGDVLFANGWLASKTFVIDLIDPLEPKVVNQFEGLEGYSYPHSFARLPNGNVLATFQGRDGKYGAPGGLVEIAPSGKAIRGVSALAPGEADELAWPYSLAIVPGMDRAVVSMAEMGMPPWKEYASTNQVQIWATDELRLIASAPLPEENSGWRHHDPAEPRVLADGTVYVSTFTCGLYRIDSVDGDDPQAEFVYGFPGGDTLENTCSVPVVVGNYWVQTVFKINGLIVLDVSDPKAPVEVSRLVLDERYAMPHWVAADRKGERLVVTGMDMSWVLVVKIDKSSGALTIDETFRDADSANPGIDFNRPEWPHGETGGAVVHGALFGG